MAKKTKAAGEQPSEALPDGFVRFENGVSWSGEEFSYAPGQIVTLPLDIAQARQDAELGMIVDEV